MVVESKLLPPDAGETIDLTPLIDCIFMLLIFFAVATTLRTDEQSLELQLPAAGKGSQLAADQRATIAIDEQGRVFYNNEPIEITVIAERLRDEKAREVIMRGDGRIPYQTVIDVIDQCYAAEVNAVGLATLERARRR